MPDARDDPGGREPGERTVERRSLRDPDERRRAERELEPRPDYLAMFQQLWGSARDVFAGVARDERGVPDPDPEPDANGS